MLTRKCDICGAEMRITTPRYKGTFDGWTYTEEVDICVDCFERIAEEIKQADTPQTDMDEDIVRSYGFKVESYRQAKAKDEPQKDCGWK